MTASDANGTTARSDGGQSIMVRQAQELQVGPRSVVIYPSLIRPCHFFGEKFNRIPPPGVDK